MFPIYGSGWRNIYACSTLARCQQRPCVQGYAVQRIEEELREIVKEKFEDPNVIDKMLGTLRDSVSLVGDLFDVVRKKSADGAKK